MAAPTPTVNTYQPGNGQYGITLFRAAWTTTDNFADQIVVNLSGLAGGYTTSLLVRSIYIAASPDLDVVVEIDATSDELVWACPLGSTVGYHDFTQDGRGSAGLPKQTAGETGDIVVTTASAASGDYLFICVEWKAA
jgi:hypothetical protein